MADGGDQPVEKPSSAPDTPANDDREFKPVEKESPQKDVGTQIKEADEKHIKDVADKAGDKLAAESTEDNEGNSVQAKGKAKDRDAHSAKELSKEAGEPFKDLVGKNILPTDKNHIYNESSLGDNLRGDINAAKAAYGNPGEAKGGGNPEGAGVAKGGNPGGDTQTPPAPEAPQAPGEQQVMAAASVGRAQRPGDVQAASDKQVPLADRTPPPGDKNNLDRPVDPTKDNPEAVSKRYGESLDKLVQSGQLSEAEAKHMRESFNKYMDNMAGKDGKPGKYSPEEMGRICASMNQIMDSNRMSDMSKANTMVDLASKGDNAQDSNGQGGHNTCAPTSLSRIMQQKDFASYAEQMGSVASRGGAWMGGENGSERQWVAVNQANFIPDGESRGAWKEGDARNGQRGMCTQLDNAVTGQYMADLAGKRDGKQYEYVTANAHLMGARPGQSQTGEGLFEIGEGGSKTFKGGCPPATIDIVAQANNNMGGGGVYVQENLANSFRGTDGKLPPGMKSFSDAADLRNKLKDDPSKGEHQIVTNGTMVAGRQGHGLHAQTVGLNKDGQLEFGNNWTADHNHRVYNDQFVNNVTNPKNWGGYQNETGPDGKPDPSRPRDWKKEYMDDDKNRTPEQKKDAKKEEEDAEAAAKKAAKKSQDDMQKQAEVTAWMGKQAELEARSHLPGAEGEAAKKELAAHNSKRPN